MRLLRERLVISNSVSRILTYFCGSLLSFFFRFFDGLGFLTVALLDS